MPEKRWVEQHDARFTTTHWSLVLEAGDAGNPACRAALEELCRIYWVPVYGYVRRSGKDAEQARDSTQAFFAFLLEKGLVGKADRQRGRFRSFLLSSVRNFLINEWDKDLAWKRGAGQSPLSLDFDSAEKGLRIEPSDGETPETLFERQWAHSLLERTHRRLECEMEASGHSRRFQRLQPYLVGSADGTYEDAASALEMSESAVKVTVHRMRKRFGSLLREEVAHGLGGADEVEAEIRYLFDRLE